MHCNTGTSDRTATVRPLHIREMYRHVQDPRAEERHRSRQEFRVAMVALGKAGIAEPFAAKHVPVSMTLDFYIKKPDSVPKKRQHPSVKPDLSKLIRSTEDAMTGILYADDAQVVDIRSRKHYGTPERVEVCVRTVDGELESQSESQPEMAGTLF